LTAVPKISKKDIVGRKKELPNLRKSILKKNQTLLVNGMGGIGKTTLAAVYVNEYFDEYDHIAWLTLGENENSLEEAVVSNAPLLTHLDLKDAPPVNQLALCLNALCNMKSPRHKLLVLDNADDHLARHYDELPKSRGWHLIVTSRNRISDRFPVIKLGFLKEDEAMRLFKKFNDAFSDDEVRTIVNGVELHTLAIELLAKSSKRNAWNMETVLSAIERDATASVDAAHNNNEKIKRIKTYFTRIFDVSHMGDHEIHLLKQFVALPNEWIDDEFLGTILQREKLDWAEEFQSVLENLCENGFVMTDAAEGKRKGKWKGKRKMHPVIVEALSPRLDIAVDDIGLLIERVTGLLKLDYAKDNPVDKFPFVPFGDSVLRRLPDDASSEMSVLKNNLAKIYRNLGDSIKARELLESALASDIRNFEKGHPTVAVDQSNLASVYRDWGEYEKARKLLESALESDIRNFGEGHPNVATRQSLLGVVYRKLGEHEKARDLLESALASDIRNFEKGHPTVAVDQSNLASVYRDWGEYEKARKLLELALESDIRNFGKGHPNVARCQSLLGVVSEGLGKYKRARTLLELALESDIKNFGEGHPKVARCRSNLGKVYRNLGEHEKARKLLELALKSDIENFGEGHPSVAILQTGLGLVYGDLGEHKKARELCQKACDTCMVVFGENHPHTKTAKANLDFVITKQRAGGKRG